MKNSAHKYTDSTRVKLATKQAGGAYTYTAPPIIIIVLDIRTIVTIFWPWLVNVAKTGLSSKRCEVVLWLACQTGNLETLNQFPVSPTPFFLHTQQYYMNHWCSICYIPLYCHARKCVHCSLYLSLSERGVRWTTVLNITSCTVFIVRCVTETLTKGREGTPPNITSCLAHSAPSRISVLLAYKIEKLNDSFWYLKFHY